MNALTINSDGVARRVQPERIQRIQRQSNDILDQSKLMRILDTHSFNQATLFLKTIKSIQAEIDSAWTYPVSVDRFGLVAWVTAQCFDSYPIGDS